MSTPVHHCPLIVHCFRKLYVVQYILSAESPDYLSVAGE